MQLNISIAVKMFVELQKHTSKFYREKLTFGTTRVSYYGRHNVQEGVNIFNRTPSFRNYIKRGLVEMIAIG